MIETLESRRLLAAGDVDTSFGTNGTLPMPDLSWGAERSIVTAVGDDEFLVVQGGGLLKVDADGQPVTSFGNNGLASVITGEKVIELADGKLLTGGLVIQRVNADGTVDTIFGEQGEVRVDLIVPSTTFVPVFDVQDDGKILVVASPGTGNYSIVRLNSDGSHDQTFQRFDFELISGNDDMALLALSNGKILVSGYIKIGQQDGIGLVGLNGNGTLDTSFGDEGFVPQAIAGGPNVLLEIPGGSFLAVTRDCETRKFSANGTHDTSFQTPGGNGVSRPGLPGSICAGILPTDDGKFIVFNHSAMTRLNANGTVDQSFGRLAVAYPFPGIEGAALTSNGDVLIAVVEAFVPGTQALMRIQGSGSTPGPVQIVGSTLDVTGSAGDDLVLIHAQEDDLIVQVTGQMGRIFDGSAVDDVSIAALGGNDAVHLFSLSKPATVSGGDGADTIVGGTGDDSLYGNAGNDRIWGNEGNDRLAGNGGRDRLVAGDGESRLFGGAGGDWIVGGLSGSVLKGEAGDDIITGGVGTDTIAGGNGDDSIFAQDSNVESLFGDAGNDRAQADADDILSSIEQTT